MRRRNRETDSFTVSFLDVASCGFGAMVILLMLAKPSDPISIEFVDVPPEGRIEQLQENLKVLEHLPRITDAVCAQIDQILQ